jgi:GTP pyrophosphokinase
MIDIKDQELERREILKEYRNLLRNSKKHINNQDKGAIRSAFEMALEAHSGMRRKSGELYIFHPLAVANICAAEIGLGSTSIICALLHDVVEDTEITLDDIQAKFGDKVANIIDGLTKINGLVGKTNSVQAENFKKIILTMASDVRVILIKMADRLHNMRTLDSMSRTGQLKIASETLTLFAPLAHRLGLYSIKSELEDLSLKYTEPNIYKSISQNLQDTKAARNKFIKTFCEPIDLKLKELKIDFEIKGRPKSIYSIYNKIKKQSITFDEVYDLFAIRIIVDAPIEVERSDCWRVYSAITAIYNPNPLRLRDWISVPKSNGYEALHTTVMSPSGKWVEIQIRSRRMDSIAERGLAAHWKYKEGQTLAKDDVLNEITDENIEKWLKKIRETLENPETNAVEFLDDFRLNLFSEEIIVFTPKGELKKLPFNSSVMDFAFDIHTEVGKRLIGAKVNKRFVPFNYILKNGDQVEILTAKTAHPEESWLGYVSTAKAKSKIKEFIREEKRLIIQKGKEELEKLVATSNLKFNNDVIARISSFLKISNIPELYFNLGQDIINPKQILEAVEFIEKAEKLGKGYKENLINQDYDQLINYSVIDKPDMVEVGGHLNLEYSFAKCCNPIPGDDIFGFITTDEIKIHRTNCPNGIKLMSQYGNRIVRTKWTVGQSKNLQTYPVGIKIEGIDGLGIVSQITDIISKELKVNMQSLYINSNAGIFEGNIILFIYDLEHLENLIQKLKTIDGAQNVVRYDVNEDFKVI